MVIANYGYQNRMTMASLAAAIVWPVVRKNYTGCRASTWWWNMSLDLQSTAAQVAGVKVHGMVPDLDEVYRRSA